jgi:hypothetical protein
MKVISLVVVITGAVVSMLLSGCGSEPDAVRELERAGAALAEDSPPPGQGTPSPAQQMDQALAAYRAGEIEDAVTRLHRLRATPALTPHQRIALNDAIAAVMTEVYAQAASGDARAIQAVKQYERLQAGQR